MTRAQMIKCYMVFGGSPYYLNSIDSCLSLAQNIDELVFKPYGDLKDEYTELFYSLFNLLIDRKDGVDWDVRGRATSVREES